MKTKPEERRLDKLDSIGVIEDPKKFKMAIWPLTKDVQCGRCHHWGAFWYQRQTRKSDEPPTTFYECESCGQKWKKSK